MLLNLIKSMPNLISDATFAVPNECGYYSIFLFMDCSALPMRCAEMISKRMRNCIANCIAGVNGSLVYKNLRYIFVRITDAVESAILHCYSVRNELWF